MPGRSALLLAFSCLALAQSQEVIFKATSALQSVAVQVTDKQGNYVQGLSAEDFTLLEDRRPQKISFFGAEHQPVSLAVLLDSSSSMEYGKKLERARTFLVPLIRGNHPEDEIFLMPFTDRVGAFRQLTIEQRLQPVAPAVSSLQGGTALYDALASALCHMRTAQNVRQAVVVITDGADQHSRLRLEQLINLAQSSNAQIFMIGFYDKPEYDLYRERQKTVTLVGERDIDNPVIVFDRLAKESGAESFFPSSERDLEKALDRISSILQAQYTLAYYPASVDRFRKIQVKVNRRGLTVMARRGVGSEGTDGPVRFAGTSCEVLPKDHPYPWELRITRDPAGRQIYRDDFSDPKSGWPMHQAQLVTPPPPARGLPSPPAFMRPGSRYIPGGYELSRTVPSNAVITGLVADGVVAAYGPWWQDFRASLSVEVDMRKTVGVTSRYSAAAGGMVFHLNESGYYALVLSGTGTINLSKEISYRLIKRMFLNSAPSEIIPWTKIVPQENSSLAPAKTHKISIASERGQITVSVDGQELTHVQDNTFNRGMVGMGLFGDGRAVFHDLTVEDILH